MFLWGQAQILTLINYWPGDGFIFHVHVLLRLDVSISGLSPLPCFFLHAKKKKKCSSSVCELGSGINRWNAHGKSESQYRNHPPYVKWPVMLCHTAQESCHIYQQPAESKSAMIGRPLHNRRLKRHLLTHFFFPRSYGSGKGGRWGGEARGATAAHLWCA